MAHLLSQGAIREIVNGRHFDNPVFQILECRPVKQGGEKARYRAIISDGINYSQSMVSSQLNDTMESLLATRSLTNTLVTVDDYVVNMIQGRRILILLKVQFGDALSEVIGHPSNIDESKSASGTPAAPAPTQQRGAPPPSFPSSSAPSSAASRGPAFGAPRQSQVAAAQPTRSFGTPPVRGPVARTLDMTSSGGSSASSSDDFTLVSQLNNFTRGKIKVRVSSKGTVRTWNKPGGNSGKLMSVDLTDSSGDIRATFFQDAVDKFENIFQEGNVYVISKFQIKNRDPQKSKFNPTSHAYEMYLDSNSDVLMVDEDDSIPKAVYNLTPLSQLREKVSAGETSCDVLGVIASVSDVAQFTSKAGNELKKRAVVLVDESQQPMEVTLWGDKADAFSTEAGHVLGIKSVRLGDYKGVSLSVGAASVMTVDPQIPETEQLFAWARNVDLSQFASGSGGGPSGATQGAGGARTPAIGEVTGERKTFAAIKEEHLGMGKTDYIAVKAWVEFINHGEKSPMYYNACPKCMKKLVVVGDANFRCEKCSEVYDAPNRRYILSMRANDHTSSAWVTAFDEPGIVIMGGKTANEIDSLKENDPSGFESWIQDVCFKQYVFKLRVKEETHQDEARVKNNVLQLQPLTDLPKEARYVVSQISNLLGRQL